MSEHASPPKTSITTLCVNTTCDHATGAFAGPATVGGDSLGSGLCLSPDQAISFCREIVDELAQILQDTSSRDQPGERMAQILVSLNTKA